MRGDPGAVLHVGTHSILAQGFSAIGWQAYEIITSILEDPSPGLTEVKGRLHRCLDAYPGAPEKALLAHLTATSRAASDGQAIVMGPPTDARRIGGNMYP